MTGALWDSFQGRAGVASKHFPQVDPASQHVWGKLRGTRLLPKGGFGRHSIWWKCWVVFNGPLKVGMEGDYATIAARSAK
jgi:hypothetical protein